MAYDFRLIDYRQDIEVTPSGSYQVRDFVGAAPFLIRANRRFTVLVQSGYAVALDAIADEPPPLFPDALLQDPSVRKSQIDDTFWKTEWSYVMAIDDAQEINLAAWCATPEVPTFKPAPT